MESNNKIKVFISSKCDDQSTGNKYTEVRNNIKTKLERTGLADVYVFEEEGSSTLSAVNHYSFALEDSDVCIFLIDNADGIPQGVQREIDIVQKHSIKALYYFCDENSKEKTDFEKSILTADNAKSKTIHSFSELCNESSQALVNDITRIYHYYCKGKLVVIDETESSETLSESIIIKSIDDVDFPKSIIDNIESTTDYLYRIVMREKQGQSEPKSDIDESAAIFLDVVLNGRSINEFNTDLFLDRLKNYQSEQLLAAVEMRWKAIQAYYDNDVEKCLVHLNNALEFSKANSIPKWFVNDLLIDIRNLHIVQSIATNRYSVSPAQEELDALSEQLYYPIVDRVNETLQEKLNHDLYKETIKSPYTVSFGNNIRELVGLIATSYVVALYFGSLTHIRLLKEKLKTLFFYLTNVYDDWRFKFNLFKYAVCEGDNKEIRELRATYPEILNRLTSEEADEIVSFCSQQALGYLRVKNRLKAFAFVGYYLDDASFNTHFSAVEADINEWMECSSPIIEIGRNLFDCLSEVAYRLPQEKLAELCCKVIEVGWSIYYQDMFKMIGNRISLKDISAETALRLVNLITKTAEGDATRGLIPISTLINLRNQDSSYSNIIDDCVENNYKAWADTYVLETTDDKNIALDYFCKTIEKIEAHLDNLKSQGARIISGTRDIYSLYLFLKNSKIDIEDHLLSAVNLMSNVLLNDQCSIVYKMDAVLLLCYININFPSLNQCRTCMSEICNNEDQVLNVDFDMFSANIDLLALKCSLKIMSIFTDNRDYAGLVELLALAKNDVATVISISRFIADLLVDAYKEKLGNDVEWLLLINSLEWMHINNNDARANATRIFLALSYNNEYSEIINRTLVNIVKNENVYLKNLILRKMNLVDGVSDETRKTIIGVCVHDSNYVTREIANGRR